MTLELIERLTQAAGKLGLDYLLIGGHAMIQHGYQRMTVDVDFLCRVGQRAEWSGVVEQYNYSVYSEANAFLQFAGPKTVPTSSGIVVRVASSKKDTGE